MPLIIGKLFNVISSFQQALIEIRKNKIAENFENEFSEVLDVLKKAAHSRKQLLNKCQELSIEVALKEKAFLETDKKYKESEILCEKLKEELIKGSKCIENLGENEVKYKEKISDLELKLFNLENEQDTTVPEKEKAFELEAERERKLLNSRISQLESELKIKDTSEMEVKAKLLETMAAMQKLEGNLEALRQRLKQELERSQNIVKDRHSTEREVRNKEDRILELEGTVANLKRKIDEMGKQINSYENRISKHQHKIDSLKKLYYRTQEQAQIQIEEFKILSSEKDKLIMMMKRKEEDLKSLNAKLVEAINEKESILQKSLNVQNQKQNSNIKCELLEKQLLENEKFIIQLKKHQAEHDSEVATLIKEKALLAKNILKMESIIEKHSSEFKINEKERITLHQDLKKAEQKLEKQNRIISNLEGMKTQLLNDITDLTKKIEKLNNDISVHEDREASMKAKIIEITSNLAQQKDISSGAITDRKIFCQQYKEMKENRDQLKQKIDILEGCINDLSQFQNSQAEEINNWKKKWESLDLQNKNLMTKLAQEETDKTALRIHLKQLEEQIQSYLQIISKKENIIKGLQTKVNYASEECMVLRSQQKTQKKELNCLEEKLIQSEIRISWEQDLYNTLKNGTKLLHLEILRLTNEKNTLMCKVNDLEKLKQNFTYAKQELHHERYKNSALENAMQQPLNVHRWRLLKGTDPEKYELIENFQTMQKQLLRKSVEVEKKDKKLSKMAKVVDQLKGMSSRKKYLEEKCARDANLNELIKEKNNKIKVLSFEINMNETYMSSYQAEISRLKEELRKLKLKLFFKEKRKIAPVLVDK
ncbi:cilia- and flagella-associated protein 58 [Trichonephila clavata]|uniref:Cilia- and flagella-associated protein 58 n=1 Tax=Trichonephila clavata TaxID=2740835 RepID=A0A8X6M540_TRICU|nr:cilia- and flagella-associated protein 58 [Trichonephila clavata]